jgi:hypothetical protein
MHGNDQDRQFIAGRFQVLNQVDPIASFERNVHEHQIRFQLRDGAHRAGGVPRLAANGQRRVTIDHLPQALPK